MVRIEGYAHQPGRHCASAALRNLSGFYHWGFSEPLCFGFGAGVALDYFDHPDHPWRVVRPGAPWVVTAFVEHLSVPHLLRDGDDWETAWDDVTSHLDDDPVVLFLDPAELPYLESDAHHVPPHPVVLVGYDDESATLSDGALEELRTVPLSVLRAAWDVDRLVASRHRYLVVTRARSLSDEPAAAADSLRETARYMLRPLEADRATGVPGEEGLPALRSFAADVPAWTDLDDPAAAASAAARSLDWHGEGAAFRDLYADALEELTPRAGLEGGTADRMREVAAGWRSALSALRRAADGDADDRAAALAEAGSVLGDVADQEEAFFERLDDAL